MAKNSYHAKVKSYKNKNGGKRKDFHNRTNNKWLRMRHKIKHRMLRG